MDQGGLGVFELRCHVSSQAEVRVLVYRAWDETGYVRNGTEYLREGIGERRSGLDGSEVDFSDVITRKMDKTTSVKLGCWDLSTHESLKPNVALAWEIVIWREIFEMFL